MPPLTVACIAKSISKSSESRHPTLMPQNHNRGNLLLPHKYKSFKTCFSKPLFSFPFKHEHLLKTLYAHLEWLLYAKPSPKPAQNHISKIKVSSRSEPENLNQCSKTTTHTYSAKTCRVTLATSDRPTYKQLSKRIALLQ